MHVYILYSFRTLSNAQRSSLQCQRILLIYLAHLLWFVIAIHVPDLQ